MADNAVDLEAGAHGAGARAVAKSGDGVATLARLRLGKLSWDVLEGWRAAWAGKKGGGASDASTSEGSFSSSTESCAESSQDSSCDGGGDGKLRKGVAGCLGVGSEDLCSSAAASAAGFWLLLGLGLACAALALAERDGVLLASAALLAALAAYCSLALGGDLFHLRGFRRCAGELRRENRRLQRQNGKFEARLEELGRVSEGLEAVQRSLGEDMEAAKELLRHLDKHTTLQQVSAALNLYFAADVNGSGHISGAEADIFVPGLTVLWALVPDFKQARLLEAVRHKGLTLSQLAVLLDTVAASDAAACHRELEALCAEGDGAHVVVRDEGARRTSRAEDLEDVEELDAVVPIFALGPVRVYSWQHLVCGCVSLVALGLVIAALMRLSLPEVVCAVAAAALACGLTASGKLLAALRALRRELGSLGVENRRLAASNGELERQVQDLAGLQRGLEKLHAGFGGCVARAQALIARSNASVKMSAISAVTNLFVRADVDRNGSLDKDEVDQFVAGLALVFRHLPDFDEAEVRQSLVRNGLKVRQVKLLVDHVLATDGQGELPPLGSIFSTR